MRFLGFVLILKLALMAVLFQFAEQSTLLDYPPLERWQVSQPQPQRRLSWRRRNS